MMAFGGDAVDGYVARAYNQCIHDKFCEYL